MKIDIASDFSKKPFGRYQADGKNSAEKFRNEFLIPAFQDTDENIEVFLDGVTIGFGSSFLEESFAGLLRNGISYIEVKKRLKIITDDHGYISEIWEYIEAQNNRSIID